LGFIRKEIALKMKGMKMIREKVALSHGDLKTRSKIK
jgi:hypothetical protein